MILKLKNHKKFIYFKNYVYIKIILLKFNYNKFFCNKKKIKFKFFIYNFIIILHNI